MSLVAERIQQANSFAEIAELFGDEFGIRYETWQRQLSQGARILELFRRAQASEDLLERLEIAELLRTAQVPFDSFTAVGLSPLEMRSALVDLSGDQRLGPIAFEQMTAAGKESFENAQATVGAEAISIQEKVNWYHRRIKDTGQKIIQQCIDAVEKFKADTGFDDLRQEILAAHQGFSDEDAEMARRVNRGELSSAQYYAWRDKAMDKWQAGIDGKQEIYDQLADAIRKTREHYNELINKTTAHDHRMLQAALDRRDEVNKAFRDTVVGDVVASSSVSQDQAQAWVESQEITPGAVKRLAKIGYPVADLKRDMAEFYRLCGGRLGKASIVTKGHRRARANVYHAVIYLDGRFNKTTLFHELGHLLEAHPKIKAATNHFLDKRTNGRKKASRLSKLTGNKGYKSDEIAYEDDFINPYVGKYYRDGITEVCSMGFQYFAQPSASMELAQRDPEMFQFMLGIMKSPMGIVEAEAVAEKEQLHEQERAQAADAQKFYKELDKKSRNIEQLIAGSEFTIEKYSAGRAKNPNRFWLIYKGQSMSGVFTKEKHLRAYIYLFLAALQAHGDEAFRYADSIATAVVRETIPKSLFPNEVNIPDINPASIPKAT